MKGKIDNLLEQANLNESESSISSAEKTFSDEAESTRIFSTLKTKLLKVEE